jgi:hypothetical protein
MVEFFPLGQMRYLLLPGESRISTNKIVLNHQNTFKLIALSFLTQYRNITSILKIVNKKENDLD